GWAGTFSAPLILLGVLWLTFGRSSRRETQRFTQAVTAMRGESQALEATLAAVAARLAANRTALGEEAARLMNLGDEATDRIGRVTHALAREADEVTGGAAQRLGAHVARIESGAEAAAARMNEAAVQMEAAVDGSMNKAAEAVDQARSGLETQGQAMLAMIEQSKAAFE